FCAGDNALAEDRPATEAFLAACRSFQRLRAIARCVLPRCAGFVHLESPRGVLAKRAPNRPERFPLWLLLPFSSAVTGLGQQLSLRLKPIRPRVTRERKSAAPLGNEIRAQTNLFVRWLCSCSYFRRHGNVCSLSTRNLLSAGSCFLSSPGCSTRA